MRYLDDLLAQRARLERYPDSVRPYIALANAFLEDRISPVEFETVYFSLFKRDETTWDRSCSLCLTICFSISTDTNLIRECATESATSSTSQNSVPLYGVPWRP